MGLKLLAVTYNNSIRSSISVLVAETSVRGRNFFLDGLSYSFSEERNASEA